MKFVLEQIAICPLDPDRAIALLKDMGLADWVNDHVVAEGFVFGARCANKADLAFNYQARQGEEKPLEFEVLSYTQGMNWMEGQARMNSVSHIGMHVTEAELRDWREFFASRGYSVAQEVMTQSHTNEHIANKRWYNYVIFATKAVLGVDVKFIVRRDSPGQVAA